MRRKCQSRLFWSRTWRRLLSSAFPKNDSKDVSRPVLSRLFCVSLFWYNVTIRAQTSVTDSCQPLRVLSTVYKALDRLLWFGLTNQLCRPYKELELVCMQKADLASAVVQTVDGRTHGLCLTSYMLKGCRNQDVSLSRKESRACSIKDSLRQRKLTVGCGSALEFSASRSWE